MNTGTVYSIILWTFLGVGTIVFISLFFITAPYGRHKRKGWGPELNNRAGWIIMESVSPIVFLLFFITGSWGFGLLPMIFLCLWLTHYIYRSFIFSSMLRGNRTMPLSIMVFAIIFNSMNAFLQSRYLYTYAGPASKYTVDWLTTPQFIAGVVVFFTGFIMHIRSDQILRNLREQGEKNYKIPRGWMFRWVSCPNYLGEMVEWTGWAILTWSLPGLFFALWTIFNLFPRALAHHKWYKSTFPEYPEERKAIIPGIL